LFKESPRKVFRMELCTTCADLFDCELLRDTEKLRVKLIREEKKVIDYLHRMAEWITAETDGNFTDHNCNESQLRVLGPAKAKKVNAAKSKAGQKVKRLMSHPRRKSTTPKKIPIPVEEASQSIASIEGERIV
jgi:hypothetical protein